MPSLILSNDDGMVRDIALNPGQTTVGRRPGNDVVLDSPVVSGRHAVFHRTGAQVLLEDLGSTNGSRINGKPVTRQALLPGDVVTIGAFRFHLVADAAVPGQKGGQNDTAAFQFVSGPLAGREVVLSKPVTTLGQPGLAAVTVTRAAQAYTVAKMQGEGPVALNGMPVGANPMPLQHGDRLEIAGMVMQFVGPVA